MAPDARTFDDPGRHALDLGRAQEDALPHIALGPSSEPVVERLLWTVDMSRAVTPSAPALQRMNDAREHSSIVNPRHPECIKRQKRLNPRTLLIRKLEEIHYLPRSFNGGRWNRRRSTITSRRCREALLWVRPQCHPRSSLSMPDRVCRIRNFSKLEIATCRSYICTCPSLNTSNALENISNSSTPRTGIAIHIIDSKNR